MISSFANKDTQKFFQDRRVRHFQVIENVARRKLYILDAAVKLDDLKVPPGNMLEALSGDRKGQNSIRINKQWRICFRWIANQDHDVEIVDYH